MYFFATLNEFTVVSFKGLVEMVALRKCLSSRIHKYLPIFIDGFSMKGVLNQVIFFTNTVVSTFLLWDL